MASNRRPVGILLPSLAIAAGILALAPAGASASSPRGCPSFASQAASQAYFLGLDGSPTHAVGTLDEDSDGVACEQLEAPYAGFAKFGYNRTRGFFFGYAAMPQIAEPEEPSVYPCMVGNRHFPDGPRRLNVYRALPGPDKALFPRNGIGAEARAESGHLVWKANRAEVLPGRYYVEFEERVRLQPSGENECPAFRSHAVQLP